MQDILDKMLEQLGRPAFKFIVTPTDKNTFVFPTANGATLETDMKTYPDFTAFKDALHKFKEQIESPPFKHFEMQLVVLQSPENQLQIGMLCV